MPNWGLDFGRPDDITFTKNDVTFLPDNWFIVKIPPISPPKFGDIYIAVDEIAGVDDNGGSYNNSIFVQCANTFPIYLTPYSIYNFSIITTPIYRYFYTGRPCYFSTYKYPFKLDYYKLQFQDSTPITELKMSIARISDFGPSTQTAILGPNEIRSMIMRLRFCLNTNKSRRPASINCKRFINVT